MDVAWLTEGLQRHTAGFAEAINGAAPDLPVPTCPEWPLRVLVGHIGQAHRWAASIVRSGPSPVPDPFDADPGDPVSWSDWLRAGARDLAAAVHGAGDRPVWTFFGSRPATFWLRRMLHDTIVHHADAAGATGEPFEVAPEFASDTITEWLELLSEPILPTLKPAFGALRGTGQTLQLRPDTGAGWLITRSPEGVRWAPANEAADTANPPDVTVAGRVRELLLVLSRRLPASQVTITGDRDLVDHWLTHSVA